MAQYYGVERSSKYLEHYGIRGMKWGVRKAIERGETGTLNKHYYKAQQKLNKLRMQGKHDKANQWQHEMNDSFKGTHLDRSKDSERIKNAIGNRRSKRLYANAIAAEHRANIANGAVNAHVFDDLFNGPRSRAYTAARKEAQEAHSAYINSLKKKQRNRYMRRIEVVD